MKRVRDIALAAWALVSIMGLVLVGGEIGAFLYYRWSYGSRVDPESTVSYYRHQSWAAAYWREVKESGVNQYRAFTVWARAPFRGTTYVIDRDGVRRTFHSHCDGRAYTIWTFGGSTMWGDGSPDWYTIPSQLGEAFEGAGRPVCIVNYGQVAYASTQEVIELMLTLKQASRKPNLVLFYDGVNDVHIAWQFGDADVHINFVDLARVLKRWDESARGSLAYLYQLNLVGILVPLLPHTRAVNRAHEEANLTRRTERARFVAENYAKNMDLVEALGRQYGFKAVFFLHPIMEVEHKPLTKEENAVRRAWTASYPDFAALLQSTYELMRAERRPNLFYIADLFNRVTDGVYIDYVHVTPEGNHLVATRIYQILQQHGL